MTIKFKGRTIDLKKVVNVTAVQKNRFRVYAGDTYSFSVIFKGEHIVGVPVREPMHFCSHDLGKMEYDRAELYEQFCQWRVQ